MKTNLSKSLVIAALSAAMVAVGGPTAPAPATPPGGVISGGTGGQLGPGGVGGTLTPGMTLTPIAPPGGTLTPNVPVLPIGPPGGGLTNGIPGGHVYVRPNAVLTNPAPILPGGQWNSHVIIAGSTISNVYSLPQNYGPYGPVIITGGASPTAPPGGRLTNGVGSAFVPTRANPYGPVIVTGGARP